MFGFNVKGKDYVIKFTTRTFAQSDLMEKLQDFFSNEADADIRVVKEMANLLADLIFEGCKKFNPLESRDAAFDLIDDYIEENKGEKDVAMNFLTKIFNDLQEEGFMGDLLNTLTNEENNRSKKKK